MRIRDPYREYVGYSSRGITLSVSFADSSPKGGAKTVDKALLMQKTEMSSALPLINQGGSTQNSLKGGTNACLSLWERYPAGVERALGGYHRITHVPVSDPA